MTTYGLTPKQASCLAFIKSRIAVDGVSPSYDEIRDAMGLAAKSGVYRLITELEARGRIRRLPGRARSIAIVESAA